MEILLSIQRYVKALHVQVVHSSGWRSSEFENEDEQSLVCLHARINSFAQRAIWNSEAATILEGKWG